MSISSTIPSAIPCLYICVIMCTVSRKIIIPTFVTKLTEYLFSRWVFFSSDKQKYLKKVEFVVLSLNLKRCFTCDRFSLSYGGLKIAILANLGQLTRDIFCAIKA